MSRQIVISDAVWSEIAKRGSFGESEDTVLRRVFGLGDIPPVAPSVAKGAAAARWGRNTADEIAKRLGATNVNPNANEYDLNGERITIRCARSTTNSVGVTFKMLERVDAVFAALETDEGDFEIIRIDPSRYSESMRDTRSKGPSRGRVGIVRTRVFRDEGELVGRISLQQTSE